MSSDYAAELMERDQRGGEGRGEERGGEEELGGEKRGEERRGGKEESIGTDDTELLIYSADSVFPTGV